jgi:hypothetical protein
LACIIGCPEPSAPFGSHAEIRFEVDRVEVLPPFLHAPEGHIERSEHIPSERVWSARSGGHSSGQPLPFLRGL